MLGTTVTGGPSPEERRRAIRTVKQHTHDSHDEAEVLAMLGLDRADAPPPKPRRRHDPLTADELREMFEPFAAAPDSPRERLGEGEG